MRKKNNWQCIDEEGTFHLEDPHRTSYLYFPLVYEAGVARRFFIDGQPAGSGSAPDTMPDTQGAAIGAVLTELSNSRNRFAGSIDEVSLWDRALAEGEVAAQARQIKVKRKQEGAADGNEQRSWSLLCALGGTHQAGHTESPGP